MKKTIYTKEQYQNDLSKLQDVEQGKTPLDLSLFKRLMIHELCAKIDVLKTQRVGRYDLKQIENALENPQNFYNILLETSQYLMRTSSFYMRINKYFSNMGLFNYSIDFYDIDPQKVDQKKMQENFFKLSSQLEKMNLKHEFSKIMETLPSEDIFYGLCFENETDFFITKVSPSLCKITEIQDGVYNYKLSLSGINPLNIGSYPLFVQQAYIQYKNNEAFLDGWYIPPADKQICIKFNESCTYPLPFLIMLARDIFDIDIYKKLKLQKARVDNYKAIAVEVPIDKTNVDKPLLTTSTLSAFAEMNKANMPDDLGMLHVPGEAKAISFKDNTNNTNNLSDAIENLYDGSGTNSQLFNGGTASSALKLSVENDAAFIYRLYRQFERYINRFIKLKKFNQKTYKFAFRIQNSTIFNKDAVTDSYLKAAEHGLPFKMDYAVSLGISQNRFLGNLFVENEILKIHTKLIPLPTSYTLSSDEVGRPTNESSGKDLDDSGEQTRESEANNNR